MIPPYDHYDVIAGQGTAALELMEEERDIEMLLVPCGGGGLSERIGGSRKGPGSRLPGDRNRAGAGR